MDRRGETGMTLVEILIAMAIFAVVLAALVPAFLSTTTVNAKSDHISSAVRLATNSLENYRASTLTTTTMAALPLSGTVNSTASDNNASFSLVTTFCPSDAPGTMVCSSTARYIRVEVFDNGKEIYQAESYFTLLR